MHVPVVNGLIAAGTASTKKVDASCWKSMKNPSSHLLAKGSNCIPGNCVRVVNSKAVAPRDDNDMTRSESGGFENGEGQRFADVDHDLSACCTDGYLAKNAIWLWQHGSDDTRAQAANGSRLGSGLASTVEAR
jgi:hypothetical protein